MNKIFFLKTFFLFTFISVTSFTSASPGPDTSAQQAILIDGHTGLTLFEKNAKELMSPSSMSKIGTVFMVFQRLKNGELSLGDNFIVSENAWRKGGSRMFLDVNSSVTIQDLLMGVIVQSGNDASIVLAEGLAGTEELFAKNMTQQMKALGATQTNLTNATGWPDPEHLTTAHDLALIARQTIELFPSLYSQFYGKNEFVYNNIRQMNRNPLLYKNIGTDGLKTGHTDTAGYGLIVSAQQDGERFILVINGLETKSARAQEAEKLMRWALIRYATLKLFGQGEIVDTANVWLGEQKAVPLVTHKDLYATILRCNLGKVLVEIVYRGPITAPIKKGDQLALVRLTSPELQIFIETPLFAGKDIEVAGVFSRISKAIHRLVFGWSRGKEALHAQG